MTQDNVGCIWEFPEIREGYLFGGPIIMTIEIILGSILGSPYLGEYHFGYLPHHLSGVGRD